MHVKRRALIDMSSVLWTPLMSGDDKEFGKKIEVDGKMKKLNSAVFAYEECIKYILETIEYYGIQPSDTLLVVEGEYSKALRKSMGAFYKTGRDTRAPEEYENFNQAKAMVVEALTSVGASAVTQGYVEADDVLAYLAVNLDSEVVIISNDRDMCALANERITVHRRTGASEENPFGPFPTEYITLYKALVGDSGDTIPGAKGFGEKAWLNLISIFGYEALPVIENLVKTKKLGDLADSVQHLPSLQKVIDDATNVYASYRCAMLYPDLVNTLRRPLEWTVGMVKPKAALTDERLVKYAGAVRLVGSSNFDQAMTFLEQKLPDTPYVAFDIETSVGDEAEDWLSRINAGSDDGGGVDVLGSELTGFSLTFGSNRQFTYYVSYDHKDSDNATLEQVKRMLKALPSELPHVVHNASFELPIMYKTLNEANYGWHGFLPNVFDTVLESNYVDENRPAGLKKLTASLLGYTQETYDEVTTIEGIKYRMNQLTAEHVLSYGADDSICTAALHNHFQQVMEIEGTDRVYQEVEVKPAYVTALAFIQGVNLDLGYLKQLQKEDAAAYAEAKEVLDTFLIEAGWEGTICPTFTELDAKAIKVGYQIIRGKPFETQVRTPSKLAVLLEEMGDTVLAEIIKSNRIDLFSKMVQDNFTGSPDINFDSPKQMQTLLYTTLGIPVRIVNKLTDKERETKPDLAKAIAKFNKIQSGKLDAVMTEDELALLPAKAATDDTAIAFALQYDATGSVRDVLNAYTTLKTVSTREKFYYSKYPDFMHWMTGKIHSSLRQSSTVTRRYSSAKPNLQQLPKKGEGVKVRRILRPHHSDAVVCSIDFTGQELRLMADSSQDKNMLACYIGDNKKDPHSITASGAMDKMWGQAKVQQLVSDYCASISENEDYTYNVFIHLLKNVNDKEVSKLASDLRKTAKNVNFAAQFDAMAYKLSQMLIIPVADAEAFLQAKYEMFPGVETWKDEVRNELLENGFITTRMGGRRHLSQAVLSEDKWERERAGRQGPNFKIQGSAAEQTKLAMARVWDSGVLQSLDMQFIAPVHDELVWSVHRDDALASIKAVHAAMTAQYADMQVPSLGSISLGLNFGDQIEVGDDYDEVAITKALASLFPVTAKEAA